MILKLIIENKLYEFEVAKNYFEKGQTLQLTEVNNKMFAPLSNTFWFNSDLGFSNLSTITDETDFFIPKTEFHFQLFELLSRLN